MELRYKVADQFTRWINGEESLPTYMKEARTVMLSKSNTKFPPVGDVRVIAILPAISKLYEVFLLRELREQTELHHPLHPNQRGFVPGGSCLKNIAELVAFMRKGQQYLRNA